jgi:hypothetical protein
VRRVLASVCYLTLVGLLLAPSALAYNDGRGFWGETDDTVVTYAGFILIGFFPAFICIASFVQWRLEKRKQARLAAQKARGRTPEWRGGW